MTNLRNDAHAGMSVTAVILMLGSGGSIAVCGFFALLSMDDVATSTALASRFALPFVMITGYRIAIRKSVRIEKDRFKLTFIRALALVLSQLCLYVAMLKTSLAESTVLYSTAPVIIIVWRCVKGYVPSAMEAISLALAAAGVVIMLDVENGSLNIGVLIGLLSGVFQAVSQLTLHAVSRKRDLGHTMFQVYGIGTVLSVMILPIFRADEIYSGNIYTLVLLLLAALGSMSNQYLRSMAYSQVSDVSKLAPLIYASIPMAVILDALVLKSQLHWVTFVGGSMVLVGLILPWSNKLFK